MSGTIQWIDNLAACHIYILHRTQAQQKKNLVTLLRQLSLQHVAKVIISSAALTFVKCSVFGVLMLFWYVIHAFAAESIVRGTKSCRTSCSDCINIDHISK